MKWKRGTIPFIVVFIGLVCGCKHPLTMESVRTVVSVQPNQSGSFEFVLAERNAGATTSFTNEVSIRMKGEEGPGIVVWLGDQAEGVKVSWISNSALDIKAKRARVFTWVPKALYLGHPFHVFYNGTDRVDRFTLNQ